MSDSDSRVMQLFFEVFESLPRQGPGNRASTERAFAACEGLPQEPVILDLGCGVGRQTLDLAELSDGKITAVDLHAPNVARLQAAIEARGLGERVTAVEGDFAKLPYESESFDLVWSEGALYNLGLERAFSIVQGLLRPGGCFAFTDAVWLTDDIPEDVLAIFAEDYPTMGRVPDVCAQLESSGFALLEHFPLPAEAWWDDFYTPMEQRIAELRVKYAEDEESLRALEVVAEEPPMHQRNCQYYNYEFCVCRKPG